MNVIMSSEVPEEEIPEELIAEMRDAIPLEKIIEEMKVYIHKPSLMKVREGRKDPVCVTLLLNVS